MLFDRGSRRVTRRAIRPRRPARPSGCVAMTHRAAGRYLRSPPAALPAAHDRRRSTSTTATAAWRSSTSRTRPAACSPATASIASVDGRGRCARAPDHAVGDEALPDGRRRARRQDLRFAGRRGRVRRVRARSADPAGRSPLPPAHVVELAPGGAFVGAETVAPGRRAYGERFAYDRVGCETDVVRDGERAVRRRRSARARPAPARTAPACSAAHDYLVSLIGARARGDAERLARRARRARWRRTPGTSAAPRGAAARRGRRRADPRRRTRSARRARLRGAGRRARSQLLGLPLPRAATSDVLRLDEILGSADEPRFAGRGGRRAAGRRGTRRRAAGCGA